eukprot:Polyplicarium_translucidae@DN2984_c0_g1_i8.p1
MNRNVSRTTKCTFRTVFTVSSGEKIALTGSHPSIGRWDPAKGHRLQTSPLMYPYWISRSAVELPLHESVEYKYVVLNENDEVVRWEGTTENRHVRPTGTSMVIEDEGGSLRDIIAESRDLYPETTLIESAGSPDSEDASRGVTYPYMPHAGDDKTTTPKDQYHHQDSAGLSTIDENDALVIVSFELPVKVVRSGSGFEIVKKKSLLLPTLHQLRQEVPIPTRFIGWPGIKDCTEDEQRRIEELLEAHDCFPVFPPEETFSIYNNFCHRFLFPLYHSVLTLDLQIQEPFEMSMWSTYQAMNRLWAEAVVHNAHENDMIWVHDFHLLLVPSYVTRKLRRANVGLFLHTPFPSFEIFRCLPVREEILRGMLCADLVGFHFFEYARHFLVSCKRLLGIDHHFRPGGILAVEYSGRDVLVRIGHVHVQYETLRQVMKGDGSVASVADELRRKHDGKFVFASVDRCERLAGLILKIHGFNHFLQTHSYAMGNAVLIQYAYPSSDAQEDSAMTETLKQLVADTNRELNRHEAAAETGEAISCIDTNGGAKDHIIFEVKEVTPAEKYGLFTAADCLLDTSIRDGLNLNPFEYICCHRDDPCPLVISEFTGSSRALSSALRVNPWKAEDVASAMDRAVTMPPDELRDRFCRDQIFLESNSTLQWAEEFLTDLRRARKHENKLYVSWGFASSYRVLGMDAQFRLLNQDRVVAAFKHSQNRVLFFDHEGTLAPDRRHMTAIPGAENLASKGNAPSESVKRYLRAI